MPESLARMKSTNVRFPTIPLLRRLASFSPSLGARVLEAIFLSPRRHPVPQREQAWLETSENTAFESRGRRLAAWSWGSSGPAVLLVHGWEGRGAQLGAFVEPLLSKGFRVVTFDGPGHGISGGNRSSLIEMGAAVLDATRKLGPFHGAVAHSAGAAATTLALREGASIDRMVYVAPPADLGEFLGRVAAALELPRDVIPIARRRIAERFGFRWDAIAHFHLAQSMTAPLLVIHDSDDREIEVENGVRLASLWRGSRIEVTSGLGHRRILREEGVVSLAVGFLAAGAAGSHAGMVGTTPASSEPSSAEARTTRSLPPLLAR